MKKRVKKIHPEKFQILRKTDDDWHPSLPGGFVRIFCLLNATDTKGNIWHRVAAWGNDDDGLEKDFVGTEFKDEAKFLYDEICKLEKVNKNDLKARGFVNG